MATYYEYYTPLSSKHPEPHRETHEMLTLEAETAAPAPHRSALQVIAQSLHHLITVVKRVRVIDSGSDAHPGR
jgi:hypothetical protein